MSDKVIIKCKGASKLKLDELKSFQGDLKYLSDNAEFRLRKSILKFGFSNPISVWRSNCSNYILDGHQRVAVLNKLKNEGYKVPALPVVIVDADSYKEAKEKLLSFVSVYGEVTDETLAKFIAEAQLDAEDIFENYKIPDIDMDDIDKIIDESKTLSDFGEFGYGSDENDNTKQSEKSNQVNNTNKEIDIDDLTKNINAVCPRCGFEFEK